MGAILTNIYAAVVGIIYVVWIVATVRYARARNPSRSRAADWVVYGLAFGPIAVGLAALAIR